MLNEESLCTSTELRDRLGKKERWEKRKGKGKTRQRRAGEQEEDLSLKRPINNDQPHSNDHF